MAYDHFKTLYKAFQCSKRDLRLRTDQVVHYSQDCLARFGEPTHIIYGSDDLEALLTSVFPEAELVFDPKYADQFWIGYPDENKYLVSGDVLEVLFKDQDTLDGLDPTDTLHRRKKRPAKSRKPTLASLPGYDELTREVEGLIAATPESGVDEFSDVPF